MPLLFLDSPSAVSVISVGALIDRHTCIHYVTADNILKHSVSMQRVQTSNRCFQRDSATRSEALHARNIVQISIAYMTYIFYIPYIYVYIYMYV